MSKKIVEIFGAPISTYTDGQAVEDGFLVAVTRRDRVTRPVFEYLVQAAPEGAKPPDRWPVDMMGWFRGKTKDDKALALAVGLINGRGQMARRVYEENTAGGIWCAWAAEREDKLVALSEVEPSSDAGSRRLWLIPNEIGGMTLMFPEDY